MNEVYYMLNKALLLIIIRITDCGLLIVQQT